MYGFPLLFLLLNIAAAPTMPAAASRDADVLEGERRRLEGERRELSARVEDQGWMQRQSQATFARLRIENGWKECAANEAAALAQASNRPAKLLAEAAVRKCGDWERLLSLALERGAYPFLSGYPKDDPGFQSREDMVALAELNSREAALSRIRWWRSGERVETAYRAPTDPERSVRPADPARPVRPAGPADRDRTPAASNEEQEIVVVGHARGGCRVRLADRTLTDRELAANAAAWAANGTHLRVVRPRGADYHCLAKIVFRLGEHGVRLFRFVDRPDPLRSPSN